MPDIPNERLSSLDDILNIKSTTYINIMSVLSSWPSTALICHSYSSRDVVLLNMRCGCRQTYHDSPKNIGVELWQNVHLI